MLAAPGSIGVTERAGAKYRCMEQEPQADVIDRSLVKIVKANKTMYTKEKIRM